MNYALQSDTNFEKRLTYFCINCSSPILIPIIKIFRESCSYCLDIYILNFTFIKLIVNSILKSIFKV